MLATRDQGWHSASIWLLLAQHLKAAAPAPDTSMQTFAARREMQGSMSAWSIQDLWQFARPALR